MGLVENAEKENIEQKKQENVEKKNVEMKNIELGKCRKMIFFFCAINSNDKKILYFINDKKKDNRKYMTN